MEVGSTAIIHAFVRNTSTNKIFTFHNGALPHDFGVFLIDETGKRLDLTPSVQHPTVSFGSLHLNIEPGTVSESEARLLLETNLPPGKYELELARDFDILGSSRSKRLVSNILVIQLVRRK
jgi:hypothetical protein